MLETRDKYCNTIDQSTKTKKYIFCYLQKASKSTPDLLIMLSHSPHTVISPCKCHHWFYFNEQMANYFITCFFVFLSFRWWETVCCRLLHTEQGIIGLILLSFGKWFLLFWEFTSGGKALRHFSICCFGLGEMRSIKLEMEAEPGSKEICYGGTKSCRQERVRERDRLQLHRSESEE